MCIHFKTNAYKLNDSGISNLLSDTCVPNTIGVVLMPSLESNSTSFKFADMPTLNNHCMNPTAEINIAKYETLLETVNAPNIPKVKTPAPSMYSMPKKCLLYLLYNVINRNDNNNTMKE